MSGPLPISGIAHVGLRVSDLTTAREFYRGLGFHFIAGPIGPEPVAIMRHPSGVEINFILNGRPADGINMLMDVPEKHCGYTHVALAVDDIGAVEAALREAGIAITEGPVTFDTGAVALFIRDPDGNVIEFNQAAE